MKIAIYWHTDDVLGRAKDLEIAITQLEAEEILMEIDRKHDASVGINWDVLDSHIRDFADDR